jgi:hypothetical protein
VTKNFLGTFTSRYSNFDGYWLFGFLVGAADLDIDLLGDPGDRRRRGDEPSEHASLVARTVFLDQLAKHRFSVSRLRDARLAISTSPTACERLAGGSLRAGCEMTFVIVVTTDHGGTYRASCSTFVAPHDAALELQSRSTRFDGG